MKENQGDTNNNRRDTNTQTLEQKAFNPQPSLILIKVNTGSIVSSRSAMPNKQRASSNKKKPMRKRASDDNVKQFYY